MAICAGVGGLELGLKLAIPKYRTVCYVEREAYAAACLVARMADEALDEAPVWDDLATFDGRPWYGIVDIVSAGFPCQPFSQAGPGRGIADPRWLWPLINEIIRDVRPSYIFLENTPRIHKEALGIILGDLSCAGFDAEWDVFSAAEAGYPHLRKRFFLLAADSIGLRGIRKAAGGTIEEADGRVGDGLAPAAADALSARCKALCWRGLPSQERNATTGGSGGADASHSNGEQTRRPAEPRPECAFWCAQSGVCVLDDGSPYRLDRLGALGNAVVPAVAARAWTVLMGRMETEAA